MSDDKILVFGASGFLGRWCCRVLADHGVDVHGTLRGKTPEFLAGIPTEICDIAETDQLLHLLDALRPTVIVNCAVMPDFTPGTLAKQYPVNALAPAVMAHWSATNDAYLVQASATLVHGVRTEQIGPGSPIAVDTDYGQAKWLAEEMIRASGCQAALLRFGGLFGRGGPAHLGLNKAIDAAVLGERPTVFATGAARRNYLHGRDAAEMIAFAIQERLTGEHHAGGAETLSIAQWLQAVCDAYLDGGPPSFAEGNEAVDQIVAHSPELPQGRSAIDAIAGDR